MLRHHQESIENVRRHFADDPEVLGLLLGGSIAHGFAGPTSDVDLIILVSDEDFERRRREERLSFFDRELCTYPDGYADGKYVGLGFLDQVAERGSEPARFAFCDAQVLISRMEGLDQKLREITRYPVEGKQERLDRFAAQLEAWHWYVSEAVKKQNRYLLWLSIGKLVLFGGRMLLAHNEMLYPYHKWLLRVLEQAPDKPEGLMESIQRLYADPGCERAEEFRARIKEFRTWTSSDTPWPNRFMLDSELNWLHPPTPVDDL